ncbi:hypothetical protein C0J52_02572 [Blattella germanica]|nr:hypothetical protein C0J52_02572 [Blattella germanica]
MEYPVSLHSVGTCLALLYCAVLVYSLYKDLQERENKNSSYGGRILLPSKNWDEALSPYTSYDPSVATPVAWGYLPPPQSNKGPAPPPPPMQKPKGGIPRPQSTSTYSS